MLATSTGNTCILAVDKISDYNIDQRTNNKTIIQNSYPQKSQKFLEGDTKFVKTVIRQL